VQGRTAGLTGIRGASLARKKGAAKPNGKERKILPGKGGLTQRTHRPPKTETSIKPPREGLQEKPTGESEGRKKQEERLNRKYSPERVPGANRERQTGPRSEDGDGPRTIRSAEAIHQKERGMKGGGGKKEKRKYRRGKSALGKRKYSESDRRRNWTKRAQTGQTGSGGPKVDS